MARVVHFPKSTYLANTTPLTAGQKALAEFINSLPKGKSVDISKGAKPFKIDIHDRNFDKPLSKLYRTYE